MRKILLVVTVLFVAAQAYGGTVTMSVDDEGGLWAAIRYSADANVSAFGLKVTADSGAIFTEIKDYNVGECTATVQGYGIFPGTIDINEDTGLVDYNGTPVAPNTAPGANDTGFSTGALVLEMGALYADDSCQPDLSGTLILVKVDKDCNVCVETESIRGNVVLTDANEAIVVYAPNCAPVSLVTECFVWSGQTQDEYDEWALVERPECWCYPRQCHGDADGKPEGNPLFGFAYVDQGDLSIMALGWKVKNSENAGRGILDLQVGGVPVACADFARDLAGNPLFGFTRIDQTDLTKMSLYWKKKEGSGQEAPTDCNSGNRIPPP